MIDTSRMVVAKPALDVAMLRIEKLETVLRHIRGDSVYSKHSALREIIDSALDTPTQTD